MARTKLVAIINITPDSFSDGGEHFTPEKAVAAIQQAFSDGADVVDIGAESTRPGATPLTHTEEWARLEPVLKQLNIYPKGGIISVDTRHAETARKALALGVHLINDVSGFQNADMINAVKSSHSKLVMMHSLSVPADKNIVMPEGVDVVHELISWAKARIAALENVGIAKNRLIFDPGIGFGKKPEQSQDILQRVEEFSVLNVPLFIGHSRKSFLMLEAQTNAEKDAATLAISRALAAKGIDYIRVHNVKLHRQMLEGLAHVA